MRWAVVLAVVAVLLIGVAMAAPGDATLPRVTHEGRPYVALAEIAKALGATIEDTEDGAQVYLRLPDHAVTFTRNWARVQIDGKPRVLSAPVRLTNDGWLIPEKFVTDVMPKLAPARATATAPSAPERETVAPEKEPRAPGAGREAAPPTKTAPPVKSAPAAKPAPPASAGAVAKSAPASRTTAPAKSEVVVSDVRVRSYPTFTEIVVETTGRVQFRADGNEPKETRVRLLGVGGGGRVDPVQDGFVDEVRLERAGEDTVVRVMFGGTPGASTTKLLSDPSRLVIDFTRPEAPAREHRPAAGPLRTIVLDAGHGGQDSGALGPTGLMEKELVLDVTRRVARLVQDELGIKVLQSRPEDHFITLRDRTSFANRANADLFVSIHANAHRDADRNEGVETYFLSTEATDGAARHVAAVENNVVKLEKNGGPNGRGDIVKTILWDLAQSEFQMESSRLAEVVQDSMTRSLRISNRGVKQAGFYVLGGAAMPAILIEIGFVTNPREERRLKDSHYRDEIARAIANAIGEYKRYYDQRMRAALAPR